MQNANPESVTRGRFALERSFLGPTAADLWDLWTTKAGIESWWGPAGFDVKVTSLDLRCGGEISYVLTAIGPEQIASVKEAGLPCSTECLLTITEVNPSRRLAFSMVADFFPNVSAYNVATVIEFDRIASGVSLKVDFDAMHDDHWTDRVRACHLSQLQKLVDQLRLRI